MGRLDRARLKGYFDDRFRRAGIVVTAVGNLRHEAVAEAFERALSSLPLLGEPLVPVPDGDGAGDVPQAEAPRAGAPVFGARRFAAQRQDLLDGRAERDPRGSSSSRLFQQVREEGRMSVLRRYSCPASPDIGILDIYAGTEQESAAEVPPSRGRWWTTFQRGGITDEEVSFGKELIKGNTLLSLESTGYRMSCLAMNEMFLSRLEPPEAILDRVDAVSPEEVRTLAAEVLRRDRFLSRPSVTLADAALSF